MFCFKLFFLLNFVRFNIFNLSIKIRLTWFETNFILFRLSLHFRLLSYSHRMVSLSLLFSFFNVLTKISCSPFFVSLMFGSNPNNMFLNNVFNFVLVAFFHHTGLISIVIANIIDIIFIIFDHLIMHSCRLVKSFRSCLFNIVNSHV